MEENKNIDFDYLNEIKYHKLKEKLTELGIPEIWVGGKAKKDIINNALKKLANIKKLKEEGIGEDDIQKQLDLINIQEKEEAKQESLEQEAKEKEEKAKAKEEVKKYKYTQEQIKRSLEIIDMNLKNNVPGQRKSLLEKRALLKEMIKE